MKKRYYPVFWNFEKLEACQACINKELTEYSMDTVEHRILDVPRDYKNEEIIYKFNNYGYRCNDDFNTSHTDVFLIAGDSFVVGEGIKLKDSWPYLLIQALSRKTNKQLPHLTLGWSGASSKRVTKQILEYVTNYDVDTILAFYPSVNRTTVISNDPAQDVQIEDTQILNSKFENIYKLLNDETFLYYYIQDILMAQQFCEYRGIRFNWATWDEGVNEGLTTGTYAKYFPNTLKQTCINAAPEYNNIPVKRAKDGYHPGKSYNFALYEKFLKFYVDAE